jgi:hypothetical protein
MTHKVLRALFVSVVFLGLTTSLAEAELIDGLSFDHYPRVYSADIQVDYDADGGTGGTGLLTASGWTWDCYEENSGDSYALYGDFYLEVEIDKSDSENILAASGYLTVDDPGGPVEDLFYSTAITDFGFGGNDLLQFLFVQEGSGMMAPDGEPIGIIISGVSIDDDLFSEANPPTFLVDFYNNYNGSSNTFYLPEPTTMLLLTIGLGSMCIRRRRRK